MEKTKYGKIQTRYGKERPGPLYCGALVGQESGTSSMTLHMQQGNFDNKDKQKRKGYAHVYLTESLETSVCGHAEGLDIWASPAACCPGAPGCP